MVTPADDAPAPELPEGATLVTDADAAPAESGTMTAVANVAGLVEFQDDAPAVRSVLKAEGTRVVMFAFEPGQELKEHTAAMPILLQCVSGSVEVSAVGRTETLDPGDVLHLTTRLPHAVYAPEPSVLMLTMLIGSREQR